jgi:Sporulation and spore germination
MKNRIVSAISILLFITACNSTFEIGIEHSPTCTDTVATNPIGSQMTAISTVPVTTDYIPASATSPVLTDIPVIQADASPQMIKIFLIAVDDNGKTGFPVGCGDSAVPVQVEIPPTHGVLKAALQALLSVKEQYYGQSGLYNALYQSDLQVESVSIDNNGQARVYLTGSLVMGGECDTPRVQAQVEQTALQFTIVKEVAIFINGKLLA